MQKRIWLLLLLCLTGCFCCLLPDKESDSIAHQFHHKTDELVPALQDWKTINPDIMYLLEFKTENQISSIPVVYTPSDPMKYFRMNVYEETDTMGTAFLDETSPPESQNRIINGHSSKTKNLQFTFLQNYKNQEYFDSYPFFTLIEEEKTWNCLVIAIADYNLDNPDTYTGWFNPYFRTRKDTENMLSKIQEYSFFYREIPYDGQRLLTLITCNMQEPNTRTVLHALCIDD